GTSGFTVLPDVRLRQLHHPPAFVQFFRLAFLLAQERVAEVIELVSRLHQAHSSRPKCDSRSSYHSSVFSRVSWRYAAQSASTSSHSKISATVIATRARWEKYGVRPSSRQSSLCILAANAAACCQSGPALDIGQSSGVGRSLL